MIKPPLEKLGYYLVDNKKYYSKIKALDQAQKQINKIQFVYNDDVFGKYDWTQEPEPDVSILEFYKRRAQQLREQSDYLVLMYSGGPDSTMMLKTFVDNNIYIDEIVNFNSYQSTGVLQGTVFNADYYYNVEPYLQEVKKTSNVLGQISVLDEIEFTQLHWNDLKRNGHPDLVLGTYSWPTAWVLRGVWVKFVKHIWDQIQKGRRVIVVYGSDKTRLQIKQGRYCTWFMDFSGPDAAELVAQDSEFHSLDFIEYFFHSPDAVPMIIKQAHLLKNYVENHATIQEFEPLQHYADLQQRARNYCSSKRVAGNLCPESYHNIVYPGISLPILTPKPGEMLLRANDNWWIKSLDPAQTALWRHAVGRLFKNYSQLLDVSGPGVNNLPHLASKPYFLES
jgi:hypothetical protein